MLNPADAFGQALRHFRTSMKISQERLSQESGLDRTYISLLERGLRQPSLNTILQIAKVLGISSVKLIEKVEVLLNENPTD
jgi:transcriptional regulator with XRE-family HTH domain